MQRKRKGYSGWVVLLAFVGIYFFLDTFAWRALDRIFLVWPFPRDGHPALVGSWVGSLTTATGRPLGVLLDMYLPDAPEHRRGGRSRDWRSAPYGEIEGTLQACDARGQLRDYTIEGAPEDRHARGLHFYATPADTPAVDGLTFSWFKGAWDQADRVRLNVQLYWRKGQSAISGDSYPDTRDTRVTLGRGGESEFRALCARLGSSASRGRGTQ